eukprot:751670-Hanusia_phi.AAC.5
MDGVKGTYALNSGVGVIGEGCLVKQNRGQFAASFLDNQSEEWYNQGRMFFSRYQKDEGGTGAG